MCLVQLDQTWPNPWSHVIGHLKKKCFPCTVFYDGSLKCNATHFSWFSSDLRRNGKTITEEEHDKLVSVTANSEFHLSSKTHSPWVTPDWTSEGEWTADFMPDLHLCLFDLHHLAQSYTNLGNNVHMQTVYTAFS